MILENKNKIRQVRKKPETYVLTIKNKREIKKNKIVKSIIVNDLQFPVNKTIMKQGNSKIIRIPSYLIKNKLLKKGSMIDKIEI